MATAVSTQFDFQRIPLLGMVAESSATVSPPASPVNGQFWYDSTVHRMKFRENGAWVLASNSDVELTANKGAASGYASLDGSTKVPIAQIPTGTSGTTVALGNDSRFTDSRAPSGSAGGSLAGTYPNPTIAAGAITTTEIAAALKDPAAATVGLRTLGTGSTQAFPGNGAISSLGVPTVNVDWGGFKITGLGAPTSANDAARLVDLQNAQAGIDLKPSVRAASTANVVIASALENGDVIDGITLVTGDRVLLKNQSTAAENGAYIVPASGAAARATDVINPNTLWTVEEGTANESTSWMVTNNGTITTGSTSLVISQYAAGGSTYIGTTNRVTVTGTQIDIAATYVGQTSITTVGTITTGVWTGTTIAIANGGTGATSASAARTALGAGTTNKFTQTVGAITAGVAKTVNHGLGTEDVVPSFREASTGKAIILGWTVVDANNITIDSDIAYAASAVKAVVVG